MVTALVETSIGVTLLVSPPFVAGLLLGASLDAPAALIVGRVAGVALLSLGGVCWLARDDGPSRAVHRLIAMMLAVQLHSRRGSRRRGREAGARRRSHVAGGGSARGTRRVVPRVHRGVGGKASHAPLGLSSYMIRLFLRILELNCWRASRSLTALRS